MSFPKRDRKEERKEPSEQHFCVMGEHKSLSIEVYECVLSKEHIEVTRGKKEKINRRRGMTSKSH